MSDENIMAMPETLAAPSTNTIRFLAYRQAVWEYRDIYFCIALYVVAAGALTALCGHTELFEPFISLEMWVRGALGCGALYVLFHDIPRAITGNPTHPFRALQTRLTAHLTPEFYAGLTLFTAIGIFFGAFTSIKNLMDVVIGFRDDAWLADLSRGLHLGHSPWRLLQPIVGHHLVTRTLQFLYMDGWMVLLVGFCATIVLAPRLEPLRRKFFYAFILCWIVLGNIVAALFMSAGPVYYGYVTGDMSRYGELLKYLSFSNGLMQSSTGLQMGLWELYRTHQVELGSGISAFPSLHVAIATLLSLAAFEIDLRLGLALAAFTAVILIGSVHLAWHYAIDGYFSIVATIALWMLAKRLAGAKT